MALNMTTVETLLNATVASRLEDRCQAITEDLLTGLSTFDTTIKLYGHDSAESVASCIAFLDLLSAWMTTNSVYPSALQLGGLIATADRTIITDELEDEVEANVGDHAEEGIPEKIPELEA